MNKMTYIKPQLYCRITRMQLMLAGSITGDTDPVEDGGNLTKQRGILGIEEPDCFPNKGIWDDL